MAHEGFAKPWLEFEEELGERMRLEPPVSRMLDTFARYGGLMASKYTFPAPDPSVKTEDTTTEDGLKLRIYTPDGYTGGKPVCVYYHGGGWAMGDINGDDPFSRAIAKLGGIVVVSVEYGLAPQNEHPGLINDCYKGLQWALGNAKRLNTIQGKFLTAGVSAGGGLAFSSALKAIDDGLGDQLVGVIGLIPATIHPDGVPEGLQSKYTAMTEHDQHTINTSDAMKAFWDAFGAPPTDPYASPLLHSNIKHLKKVYLAVAGHDTLRDDGVLMKQKLDEAAVPSAFDLYEGYPHFFFAWPSAKLDTPRKRFYDNLSSGIKFVLS
ncbi:arylacetamide deacetylase [Cucurbitaria berberidis CBS 394.84]|uniref:Arylacetamide deacetylase n=1 Tax=Cucurbitaria berberidis CBS 394.84 TaxID=1168544 RepID=A0A9P4GJC9_9PLEO|nr:arylacetamide deacetylase [Cucurbitaria berberidis CBS 394.84]KAF1846279.1 arylacetamide deacetylase [Cucurbitaria berberidis CBS 394.84]